MDNLVLAPFPLFLSLYLSITFSFRAVAATIWSTPFGSTFTFTLSHFTPYSPSQPQRFGVHHLAPLQTLHSQYDPSFSPRNPRRVAYSVRKCCSYSRFLTKFAQSESCHHVCVIFTLAPRSPRGSIEALSIQTYHFAVLLISTHFAQRTMAANSSYGPAKHAGRIKFTAEELWALLAPPRLEEDPVRIEFALLAMGERRADYLCATSEVADVFKWFQGSLSEGLQRMRETPYPVPRDTSISLCSTSLFQQPKWPKTL